MFKNIYYIPLLISLFLPLFSQAAIQPNFIVIMVDEVGVDDLGCYSSSSKNSTPNINALAKQGMRFSDAHAAGLSESSSHYGLLTGMFPFRSSHSQQIDGEITLPAVLKSQGYVTGMIGHWPLDAEPREYGFDQYDPALVSEIGASAIDQINGMKKPFMLYLSFSSPTGGAGYGGDYLMAVDTQVGKVMATLEQQQIAKDTLVFLAATTGSRKETAESFRGKKGDLWEGGHRIPFIARWPQYIKPNSIADPLVCLTDLMATFARVTKYTLPHDAGADSFDLIPLLIGRNPPKKPIRGALVIQAEKSKKLMIRSGNAKLITASPQSVDANGQLYNLKKDPEEQDNLYIIFPQIVDKLAAEMVDSMESAGSRHLAPFGTDKAKSIRFVDKRKYPIKEETDPLKPYTGPSLPNIDNKSVLGKVMVGYQGWFSCEGDGADFRWSHWGRGKEFSPNAVTVDLWPETSDYPDKDLFETDFKYEDGTVAKVFSSFKKSTAVVHFEWMRKYGIQGAFLQRFPSGFRRAENKHHKNVVLANIREGANRAGCTYALMYDLTGLKPGGTSIIIDDWTMLQKKMKLTSDPAYQHHRGKPLVSLWGIGFNEKSKPREYTMDECRTLIQFFKDQGCSVKIGAPSGWRTLDRDSRDTPDVHELLLMADIVSPWTPGRYRTIEGVKDHAEERWGPDVKWLKEKGVDYIPVIFPGFSWHNNKGGDLAAIPRMKGKFIWAQAVAAKKSGCEMLYIAMFDEVDEGTAIFKCTDTPPMGNGGVFLTYEGLPSDFYMRLVGHAGRMIRDEIPISEETPTVEDFQ